MFYEMATGTPPFHGDSGPAMFVSIARDTPVSPLSLNPGLPPELSRVIDKCLEKDPGLRPRASEICAALRLLKLDSASPSLRPTSFAIAKPAELVGTPPPSRHGTRKTIFMLAVACAVLFAVLAAGTISYRAAHQRAVLADPDTIVLADFTNTTGDAVFDTALRPALATTLGQSPFLNVISDGRVNQTLKQMSRATGERLTQAVAREIGLRTNSKVYIAGAISEAGGHYLLVLKALNCETGNAVASVEMQAETRSQVIKALGDGGNQLRRKLGESLPSVEKFSRELAEATGSLEALQEEARATVISSEKGQVESIPYRKRVIEIDPNYTEGYVMLGVIYSNLGEVGTSKQYLAKAYELRDRGTDREQLGLEYLYREFFTGELEKAYQAELDTVRNTRRIAGLSIIWQLQRCRWDVTRKPRTKSGMRCALTPKTW
jgi:hypothetical protein